ncbi:MAG: DUF1801 domain-containing protein [Saprospiraceae bacterium]|jgi:hypothetical protein|nr:DUF1801 domain-containing protein [Saprospiraceae bacterium]
MQTLTIKRSHEIHLKYQTYPKEIIPKLIFLRKLIIETATEIDTIEEIEETLKWGEPSYLVKNGSTIRIDWKTKSPDFYAMYFKCTSKLVSTFKEVYGDTFRYENNRAIIFHLEDKIPVTELKGCIGLALKYHSVKNMVRLGI